MSSPKLSTAQTIIAKRKESDDAIEEIDSKRARTDTLEENIPKSIPKLVCDAVRARDVERLRELLEHKPKLDSCPNLLWMVIEDDNTEIAKMLVWAGASINARNLKDDARPRLLHALVKKIDDPRKLELIRLMLDRGAWINQIDRCGCTILDYALSILADPLEIFREFYLERGAEIHPNSLSIVAAKSNYVEYLSIFVHGSNKKPFEKPRIILKMKYKAAAAIQLLADSRSDENSILPAVQWLLDCKPYMKRLSSGALVSAVLQNRIELVKLLIGYGVDVNHKDGLICTAVKHKNSDMAELLINSGIHIHSRIPYIRCAGYKEVYPIHIACGFHADKNIELLLRSGVDVTVVDGNGQTPFCTIHDHGVLSNAHCIMIKHFVLLLEKGLKIHENDLKLIHQEHHMLRFFTDCSVELRKMVATKILDDFSYHSFLSKNIREVIWCIQNEKFLENLSQYQYKILFPLYSNDIEWVIRNTMEQRAILVKKEKTVI